MPTGHGWTPWPGEVPEFHVAPACQEDPSRADHLTPMPLVFDRICWAGSSRPVKIMVA